MKYWKIEMRLLSHGQLNMSFATEEAARSCYAHYEARFVSDASACGFEVKTHKSEYGERKDFIFHGEPSQIPMPFCLSVAIFELGTSDLEGMALCDEGWKQNGLAHYLIAHGQKAYVRRVKELEAAAK